MRGVLLLTVLLAAGCTHRQLARSTVNTASTVMDIEYQMVLDNLALFMTQPDSLPRHVKLRDGVVQITDEIGFRPDGLRVETGGLLRLEGILPRGTREINQQWDARAVVNPLQLKLLQDVYRQAVGVPPFPDPEFLVRAREEQVRKAREDNNHRGDNDNGDENDNSIEDNSRENSQDEGRSPREEFNVPTGWFFVGRKADVPPHACYVGCYGDCYVWVTPAGMADLSYFTLVVLSASEFDPEELTPARGLIGRRQ
jgi:hypothetical protein